MNQIVQNGAPLVTLDKGDRALMAWNTLIGKWEVSVLEAKPHGGMMEHIHSVTRHLEVARDFVDALNEGLPVKQHGIASLATVA